MNTRNDWFEDFQRNISELIAKSPAGDIERNVKAMMAQTFSRLDLITREEFDVQKELLERLLERVAALELRIQTLEGENKDRGASRDNPDPSAVKKAAATTPEAITPSAGTDTSTLGTGARPDIEV